MTLNDERSRCKGGKHHACNGYLQPYDRLACLCGCHTPDGCEHCGHPLGDHHWVVGCLVGWNAAETHIEQGCMCKVGGAS